MTQLTLKDLRDDLDHLSFKMSSVEADLEELYDLVLKLQIDGLEERVSELKLKLQSRQEVERAGQ